MTLPLVVLGVFSRHGFATTGYLVDEIGYSRPTVTKRLGQSFFYHSGSDHDTGGMFGTTIAGP